jgi:predicted patatin/cPLA2 family phospholipase
MENFTHPIIKGLPHEKMLPDGTALVLEGGGTRGFYSAGVFEAFMDAGIMFPYIAGVSAGAANVLTYVAGQKKRNRQIVEHYVGDKRCVSFRNLFRNRSLFGYDFIFKAVPEQHIFWDRENFFNTNTRLLTGATDCATGEPVWFEKSELAPDFTATIASCSVPLVSKIVQFNGLDLLDGGITAPIPIEKSIADGNSFHVIVLTRNQGFTQAPFKHKNFVKFFYRKYPNLVNAILTRHITYNRQLAICEQLERENKAIIIRPQLPLSVGRSTSDTAKLLALYDEGHTEGAAALKFIKEAVSWKSPDMTEPAS